MNETLTKTDRFINLMLTLLRSSNGSIDDQQLRVILGNPSKSQYHKYLIELTEAKNGREALLNREKVPGGFKYSFRTLAEEVKGTRSRPNLVLVDGQNFAEIKVYDHARAKFASAHLPSTKLEQGMDCDTYKCSYASEDDFVETIFAWADDIEVLRPESVKQKFIKKAQKAAFNNVGQTFERKIA
jgi:hypothetical protein